MTPMKCCDGGLVQGNLGVVWTSGIEDERRIYHLYVTHITYRIGLLKARAHQQFSSLKNSSTSLTAPVHVVNTTFREYSYKGSCSFE